MLEKTYKKQNFSKQKKDIKEAGGRRRSKGGGRGTFSRTKSRTEATKRGPNVSGVKRGKGGAGSIPKQKRQRAFLQPLQERRERVEVSGKKRGEDLAAKDRKKKKAAILDCVVGGEKPHAPNEKTGSKILGGGAGVRRQGGASGSFSIVVKVGEKKKRSSPGKKKKKQRPSSYCGGVGGSAEKMKSYLLLFKTFMERLQNGRGEKKGTAHLPE